MNRFEEEFEAFKKCLCEHAALIMKQREEAMVSSRGRPARGVEQLRGEDAARSAMKAQAMNSAGPPLLIGWKEIAQALGHISTRTAQRWEKCLGLPVGRVGGTPVADPDFVREWKEQHLHAR